LLARRLNSKEYSSTGLRNISPRTRETEGSIFQTAATIGGGVLAHAAKNPQLSMKFSGVSNSSSADEHRRIARPGFGFVSGKRMTRNPEVNDYSAVNRPNY
jgi:hypothetical protein